MTPEKCRIERARVYLRREMPTLPSKIMVRGIPIELFDKDDVCRAAGLLCRRLQEELNEANERATRNFLSLAAVAGGGE